MLSRFDQSNKVVTAALAAIIGVVLIGGIIGAFTSGGKESAEDKRRKQEAAAEKQARDEQQRQGNAGSSAQGSVEADKRALDLITANQDKCQNTYIPNANARADQALKDLREQRAALEAIVAQLPPGKAKDTLGSQIGPGYDSGEALIQSELRAATTDCKLAFTVFQLTREPPTTQPD